MKYRAEIDGLRALAVIPVILFHAGIEQLSGGFVGVDVFFVISGYLITTIILSEKEQDKFSLSDFYERRARRILPALFLVIFTCLPFSWFWLLPPDMKDFSESLVAVITFSSNILFWQESGYWGVENELKPLLHTWSLTVEEQYYVLFPIFVAVMWRFRKRWILFSFSLIILASLLLANWGAYHKPTASFFLLPTRAWELGIGAVIAFYFMYKKNLLNKVQKYKYVAEILSGLGLILILYSIFALNKSTPFPSFYALLPTIGAGLIILFASPVNITGKLLSNRIFVGIGLISYSAYLWHQPIFALLRHRSLHEPTQLMFLALSALTIFLAFLTWKYIERPFRSKNKINKRHIIYFGILGSVILFIFGLTGHYTEGFNKLSFKNSLSQQAISERLKANRGLDNVCDAEVFNLSKECRTSQHPEILIWGDSYAMHLVQGILHSKPDAKIIQMTQSNCGPIFDIAPVTTYYPIDKAKQCLLFNNSVRNWIKNSKIKHVVISSPFYQYIDKDSNIMYPNGEIRIANIDNIKKAFHTTLVEIKSFGINTTIFSPPPTNESDLGRCLAKATWLNIDLGQCNFNITDISQSRKSAYSIIESVKQEANIINLEKLICNEEGTCSTHIDGKWLYRDSGHLSYEGSSMLGKEHNFYKLITESKK